MRIAFVFVLALLAAACNRDGIGIGGGDGGRDLAVDGAVDLPAPCAAQSGACDYPADQWCSPFSVGTEELCLCTVPSKNWYCCHPERWACPAQPHDGDPCCPTINGGFRRCGTCTCIHGQFGCDLPIDAAAAD